MSECCTICLSEQHTTGDHVGAFREHREEAFITCREDCWCWDVEAKIAQEEVQR